VALGDDKPPGLLTRVFEEILVAVRVLVGVLMLSAIGINFANVVARRLFDSPFAWTEEVLVYIIVWMVFMGAVLVSWEGRHLRMDLLSSSLKGPARIVVNGLAVAILIALCGYVIVHSIGVVATFARTGQSSIAAGIPMTVPHFAILLGFVLILVGTLIRLGWHIAGPPTTAREEVSAEADAIGDDPDRAPKA
jgi:TRAP-type C4-dicarboxylate transport system permease small subunit